jgi:uncharacterized protein YcfJ
MKPVRYIGLSLLAFIVTPGYAQEVGKVLSSTPVIRQVTVPRQVCHTETVAVQEPKSGAGALMGAIAGGAIGNAIGDGGGRAAATMLGMVGGSVLGDKIESQPNSQLQQVQRCEWQQVVENQTTGYRVVYEFAGKQYSVDMSSDPGPTIPLQVTPSVPAVTPAQQPAAAHPLPVVVDQPVVYASPYVYSSPVRIYWNLGRWPGPAGHR